MIEWMKDSNREATLSGERVVDKRERIQRRKRRYFRQCTGTVDRGICG